MTKEIPLALALLAALCFVIYLLGRPREWDHLIMRRPAMWPIPRLCRGTMNTPERTGYKEGRKR